MEYTDILMNIRKIVRSINLESKKIQKEYGISIPQLLCLGYLAQSPHFRATHGEISRYLNLNSSTVTGLVNRLENKSLVARLPSKEDKRVVHISLTTRGAKLLEQSPSLLHDQLSKKLKKLPVEKVEEINRSLNMLVEVLEIDQISASPMITIEEPIINIDDTDKAIL